MNARAKTGPVLPFNGVDGETGLPVLADRTRAQVLAALEERPIDLTAKGLGFRVDPRDLASAGWGVIFPRDADPAVREALAELLAWRREWASRRDERHYRELAGGQGVRLEESKDDYLARLGIGPGTADPQRLPYYLLLVGGPEVISFDFQHQLDVQHAVGRIAFDEVEDYARYAAAVVAAEKGEIDRRKTALFFGTRNPADPATALSADRLLGPVAEALASFCGEQQPKWRVATAVGEAATKDRLRSALTGGERPALLFTATHGLSFGRGNPRQRGEQGALVCQDWPGWEFGAAPLAPEHYFAAQDLGPEADVAGLISFHFACFSAGTPARDLFSHGSRRKPKPLTDQPFVAALPQRLLAHPKGGALAVIGHVEQAWGYSFFWRQLQDQARAFETTCIDLVEGLPVGAAMEAFGDRLKSLADELVRGLELRELRGKVDRDYLKLLWTAHNDAKCYAILGDPATRLAV